IGEVVFGRVFVNFGLKLLAVSIGAVIYYIVLQIVLQLGLNTNDLKLITALIVALALAVPYWKGKVFRGKAAKKGAEEHA
ncbi:MAG: ABC transporter permease, partial [Oscillospiraceae bacterium]|nr:ABC transporter permease [Oscillospiraceae bacterium]